MGVCMSIWVCGEVLIDVLPTGPVVGGGPANTAKSLARLGHAVDFVGGISTDSFGHMARKELERDGVGLGLSLESDKPTSTATVTLYKAGSATYKFVIDGTATFEFSPSWLPDPERLKPSVLQIGTLATVVEPGATVLFDWAVNCAEFAPIVFDPNVRPSFLGDRKKYCQAVEKWVGISSVVKLSDEDIAWLYPDQSLDDVAHRWLEGETSLVVVTRGAKGIIGYTHDAQDEVESYAVELVDDIGAGDTVGAILVEAVAQYSVAGIVGHTLNKVLHRAAVAAGITVSRAGAQPPRMHELVEALEK
jgi:fructokinase